MCCQNFFRKKATGKGKPCHSWIDGWLASACFSYILIFRMDKQLIKAVYDVNY